MLKKERKCDKVREKVWKKLRKFAVERKRERMEKPEKEC